MANIITCERARKLIYEIESGTLRYYGKAPTPVVVAVDENGVAYICAKEDTNRLFAKADARKPENRALLAQWIR